MRAAIYCRISRDISGESLGVTRQLEDCRAFAEARDWTVLEVYTDNDISASSGKPRPEYRKMLQAVERGEVEAIIAWAPDRLYRKLGDLEELITTIEGAGATLATVKTGDFDLSTALGRMIARILGSVAQGEGEVKSERWKRSIRQRRETGTVHTMGPRLYGYERDGTIIPHEREHLEWAAGQILDGAALVRTTYNLNARGSRTSLGNEWNRAGLRTTLSNPRLAGMSTLNGDIVGVGQWQPIFDAETHEAIVAAFAVRSGSRLRQPRLNLLLGLVKCGKCGQTLKGSRRYPGGSGQPSVRTYRCDKLPGTNMGCGGVSVRAEPIEEMVEAFARELANDPRVQAHIAELSATSGARAGEALALEQRIRELEQQLSEPGVPVQAILRAIDRSKEQLETLRAQAVEPTGLQVGGEWPTDLARRARSIRNVVAEVIVQPVDSRAGTFDPDRVTIVPRGLDSREFPELD